MNDKPTPTTQVLGTLSPGAYAALERKVGTGTVVNQTTTELQAGFQLGVQHVLKCIREGFTL